MDFLRSLLISLIGMAIPLITWLIYDHKKYTRIEEKVNCLIGSYTDQQHKINCITVENDVRDERIENLNKQQEIIKSLPIDYPQDVYVYFPPQAQSHIAYLDGFRPYILYKKEGEDTLEWGKVESRYGTLHFVFDKSLENKLPEEMK